MKNNFKIITLLIIGLCALPNVFGQQSAEDDKKFRELREKSRVLLNANKSYRIRTTQKTYVDEGKTLKTTITSISEYAEPDRWYSSSITQTDKTTKKVEFIQIGEKAFVRENDGKWSVKPGGSLFGVAGTSMPDIRFIERKTFEGQTVSIYEESLTMILEDGRRNNKTRYWFTDEGRLLKEETESQIEGTNETLSIISVYEYDSKIKIEAPIK